MKDRTCKQLATKTGIPVHMIRLYSNLFLPNKVGQGSTRYLDEYEQLVLVALWFISDTIGVKRSVLKEFADLLMLNKNKTMRWYVKAKYQEIDNVVVGLLMRKLMSKFRDEKGAFGKLMPIEEE